MPQVGRGQLTAKVACFLAEQLLVRQNRQPCQVPVPLASICSIRKPISSGKIDSLPNVEAIGEARVVGSGEGNHQLAWVLYGPEDLDAWRQMLALAALLTLPGQNCGPKMYVSIRETHPIEVNIQADDATHHVAMSQACLLHEVVMYKWGLPEMRHEKNLPHARMYITDDLPAALNRGVAASAL